MDDGFFAHDRLGSDLFDPYETGQQEAPCSSFP
jgi:hypothetical protein